jgi:hypothetical protein
LVGDRATDNTTAFQTLLNAAGTAGGSILLPCGDFVITGATTLNIAAPSKNVTVQGQGLCTTLMFRGTNATTINMPSMFSAIRWGNMRVTTNAPGSYSGITVNMVSNPIPLTPGYQLFENMHFTGDDYTTSNPPTHYWSTALSLIGLSIVNINNITMLGGGIPSNPQGVGIHLNGPAGLPSNPGAAAVIFNFSNIMAGYLDTGIMWDSQTSGAHVEGISVVTSNFQSNRYGLRGATGTTGLSELAVTNSQFGGNQTAAIQINANVGDLLASNNLFELGSGQVGILGGGVDFQITGNSFASQAAGSNIGTGVSLDVSAANCFGHITSNTFTNLQYGVTITSAATCAAV